MSNGDTLSLHNEDRRLHQGTHDLSGDFTLSRQAQKCAKQLAEQNLPVANHPCDNLPRSEGENLFRINGLYTSASQLLARAMDVWYG